MKRIFIPIIFLSFFYFLSLNCFAYDVPSVSVPDQNGMSCFLIRFDRNDLDDPWYPYSYFFTSDINNVTYTLVNNSYGGQTLTFTSGNVYVRTNTSSFSRVPLNIPDARNQYYCFVPYISTAYDSSIGSGGEFWILQDQVLSLDLIQFGAYWKFDDIQNVKLTISGTIKSESFDFSSNGGYWFNPRDYGNIGEQLQLYLTPYDSQGNWGNTLFLHKQIDTNVFTNIYQAFTGYVRKATNNVDIVGIDDTEVVTITEKPDDSGIVTNPTVIKTTTTYSPVYQSSTVNEVTNYVTTNNYTTENYYNTVNYIDNSTTISVSVNISGDDQQSATSRYNSAKQYLSEAPQNALEGLQSFSGTKFEPILYTLIIGFGVLVGAALVFVLVKIAGIIL